MESKCEESKGNACDTIEQSRVSAPLQVVVPDWNMFRKEASLGEGAYGTVFKVRCLQTSMLSKEEGNKGQRVLMPQSQNVLLKRRLNMGAKSGVNMSNDN